MPERHDSGERAAAARLPPLDLDRVVQWAEDHHACTGAWPGRRTPGIIPGTGGEKWKNLNQALRAGSRGLPGGSSLMRLLQERCGVWNCRVPPR
jgi:hypothetical protein